MNKIFLVIAMSAMGISILIRQQNLNETLYKKHIDFSKRVFRVKSFDLKKLSEFQSTWIFVTSIFFTFLALLPIMNIVSDDTIMALNTYIPIGVAISYLVLYLISNLCKCFREK